MCYLGQNVTHTMKKFYSFLFKNNNFSTVLGFRQFLSFFKKDFFSGIDSFIYDSRLEKWEREVV